MQLKPSNSVSKQFQVSVLTNRQQYERDIWNKRAQAGSLTHSFTAFYRTILAESKNVILSTNPFVDFSACKRILDIGCGQGLSSIAWAQLLSHVSVLGVDISPVMVTEAKKLAKVFNLEDRCTFQVVDILQPDTKFLFSKPFDLIFGRMVLHHFNFAELSLLARTIEPICHHSTVLLFVENSDCNPLLMLFRDHLVGHCGVNRLSIATECPLDARRVTHFAHELGFQSRIVYHEMVMLRMLRRIPVLRFASKFLVCLDCLLYGIRPLRKLSYHQTVLFRNVSSDEPL